MPLFYRVFGEMDHASCGVVTRDAREACDYHDHVSPMVLPYLWDLIVSLDNWVSLEYHRCFLGFLVVFFRICLRSFFRCCYMSFIFSLRRRILRGTKGSQATTKGKAGTELFA